MATEFEQLNERLTRLENLLAEIIPLVPEGIADQERFVKYDTQKERLRRERPDRKVVTEPNTDRSIPT